MKSVWVREVHPLVKILAAALLTAAGVLLRRPGSLTILVIIVLFLGWQGGLRPSRRVGVGIVIMLLSFGLVNMAFGTQPMDILRNLLRLAVLFLTGPVFTLTVSPGKLVQSLRRSPLPDGLNIALLVIWRFIPVLLREARQIQEAARLRGLRLVPGQLQLAFRSVVMPLCFQSVSFADHITVVLEVRGFSLQHSPSIMPGPGIRWQDILFMILTVFLPLAVLVGERILCFG